MLIKDLIKIPPINSERGLEGLELYYLEDAEYVIRKMRERTAKRYHFRMLRNLLEREPTASAELKIGLDDVSVLYEQNRQERVRIVKECISEMREMQSAAPGSHYDSFGSVVEETLCEERFWEAASDYEITCEEADETEESLNHMLQGFYLHMAKKYFSLIIDIGKDNSMIIFGERSFNKNLQSGGITLGEFLAENSKYSICEYANFLLEIYRNAVKLLEGEKNESQTPSTFTEKEISSMFLGPTKQRLETLEQEQKEFIEKIIEEIQERMRCQRIQEMGLRK